MKYIATVTWTGVQCRITIPHGIVKELKLEGERYLVLETDGKDNINIRRFRNGKGKRQDVR